MHQLQFSTVLFIIVFSQRWASTVATCYFPQEYQGEYVMQNNAGDGDGIQYSALSIQETSISIWGNCHRRIDNKFILIVNIGETSCIRCLHLKLRSSNILQVFQQTISQCFTNTETAEQNCPTEESFYTQDTAEILFFKTRDSTGTPTTKEYCPIDGKYYVNYQNVIESQNCNSFNSSVGTCPSGATLHFQFQSCNLPDIRFDCLGQWKGLRDENFLVVADSRHIDGKKPKYRCAIYRTNPNGVIDMALSSDSTCTADLYNASNGAEIFNLTPKPENSWPTEVAFSMCTFPKWMRGNWEHVRVDENTLIYRDHSTMKTYTIKCFGEQETSSKYIIFTRNQCDQERYNCMRIANRSNNILEFQLGSNSSASPDVYMLCSDENFENDSWITQGRVETSPEMIPGMCPITGEYTGIIPDNTELCAKLWSDCRAPELMYYQVSHCQSNEIYEEREYKCLGHWNESDLLYTYTQRRDISVGTYECFVGSIISDHEININEAGAHCQRHINPLINGMKLDKKHLYSCISHVDIPRTSSGQKPTTFPTVPKFTIPQAPTRKTTMKNWNFDNSITEPSGDEKPSSGNLLHSSSITLYIFAVNILKLYL